MSVTTVNWPPPLEAPDANESVSRSVTTGARGGSPTVSETFTLRKITPNGKAGSITMKNGSVVSYVAPT